IALPVVNDIDNDGVADSEAEQTATAAVVAAEQAYEALQAELIEIGENAISLERYDELFAQREAAEALKAEAARLVEA
ncbi:hypothetical protein ABFO79_15125, partial [Acinetobacter schindleri]|uniref:hypothetical protein n=1 Tax=Acinetobacter schindleri TaxID=108981 RepID=UPI0032135B0E